MHNKGLPGKLWPTAVSSMLSIIMSSIAFCEASVTKISYGSALDGGKVACLLSDGGIGNLLVAKQDNSPAISWGGEGIAIGKEAQSDSDGAQNTIAIVKKLGTKINYAALVCSNYEIDSAGNTPCKPDNICYDDWFLPARYQLDCIQKHEQEIGGFANDFYWSSSEFSGYPAYSAWDKYFGTGQQTPAGENDLEHVRCARTFSPR